MAKRGKWILGGAAISLLLAAAPLAVPAANATQASTAASAVTMTSAYGCNWPEVCLYSGYPWNSPIIGRFKQETSSWQYLNHVGPWSIVNTRNDDTVYVLSPVGTDFSDPKVYCMRPNSSLINYPSVVFAIRIDPRPAC